MTVDGNSGLNAEPPVLTSMRPGSWTAADAVDYQQTQRLLDQALTACRHHQQALLNADVPRARDAEGWQATYNELVGLRAALRPEQRAMAQRTRTRCRLVLEDSARLTEIRRAINDGRARPFTPEADVVRYRGAWWVRTGLSYERLDPRSRLVQEFTRRLQPSMEQLAAADAALARRGETA
ncbi:hypothetical protein ACFT8W_20840 [Streptomyces hygroscopicus]|uniref:hypothetical protein n=1 Tax=Streptomyces hygroscopicus TaxID=1912 RepID=UPI003637F045